MNIDKTKSIIFYQVETFIQKSQNFKSKLVWNNQYLGVIKDNSLSWEENIEMVKIDLLKELGVSYKARNFFNEKYSYLIFNYFSWAI